MPDAASILIDQSARSDATCGVRRHRARNRPTGAAGLAGEAQSAPNSKGPSGESNRSAILSAPVATHHARSGWPCAAAPLDAQPWSTVTRTRCHNGPVAERRGFADPGAGQVRHSRWPADQIGPIPRPRVKASKDREPLKLRWRTSGRLTASRGRRRGWPPESVNWVRSPLKLRARRTGQRSPAGVKLDAHRRPALTDLSR